MPTQDVCWATPPSLSCATPTQRGYVRSTQTRHIGMPSTPPDCLATTLRAIPPAPSPIPSNMLIATGAWRVWQSGWARTTTASVSTKEQRAIPPFSTASRVGSAGATRRASSCPYPRRAAWQRDTAAPRAMPTSRDGSCPMTWTVWLVSWADARRPLPTLRICSRKRPKTIFGTNTTIMPTSPYTTCRSSSTALVLPI